MIRFGPGKDIDLSLAGKNLGPRFRPELLSQNDRARGLWNRLYRNDEPGCLLADEVGKGKTYVALAVAFACLASKPKGRILVLTHSAHMARVWKERWQDLEECVGSRWKARWDAEWYPKLYWSVDHLDEDARDHNLSHIAFTSYETLKKHTSDTRGGGLLRDALCRAGHLIGKRLSRQEQNALIKDIFVDCDLRKTGRQNLSESQARRILSCFDRENRWWKEDSYLHIIEELEYIQARQWLNDGARFDLLVVDEAHKLEGTARHHVVARLLRKRFEKCLLVTATPFALSIHQFRRRLLDFAHARGPQEAFEDMIRALPLDDFRKAVAERVPFPGKGRLEQQLRRHMVRACWDHDRERTTEHWTDQSGAETLLPTLLLERIIDDVLESGKRTHIASRRESLCSSWPAARQSLDDSPLEIVDQNWSRAFDAVVAGRSAPPDPKLRTAVGHLAELVRKETKVVVFTQRLETSKALARLLEAHPTIQEIASVRERSADRLRRHLSKVAGWLELGEAYAKGVVKVMAHSADCPKMEPAAVRRWWRRHKKRLGDGDADTWADLQLIIGRGRRLPIVVRHDADTGHERNVEKFNLPSAPLVLIATPKAQEGIDLHHYCRHVVLFDLTWNPAAMEQRVGRVHRIGGSRRANEKVTVVYCYQKGTYEEVMADRIQQRCMMMRVLLGAGQWLDEDCEIEELDCYRMIFPPEV